MVWFFVDDNLAFHRKVQEAGNDAMGLWVRAGAWSTSNLTDGFVPVRIARKLARKRTADRLVSAKLWTEIRQNSAETPPKLGQNSAKIVGYQFHEWEQRQFTKADIEAKRKWERERKADLRKRKRVPAGHPQGQKDVVPLGVPPGQNGDVPLGVPLGVLARARAGTPPHPTPIRGEGYVSNSPEQPLTAPPPPCTIHEQPHHAEPCRQCQAVREWAEASEQREAAAAALERAARRAAIDACIACDDNGLRPAPGGVTRCTHGFTDEVF